MTESEVAAFLDEPRSGVLSTLARDGGPHAAGMWFAVAGDAIEMWTYAKSQKALNLRRDRRCSLLVEDGVAYDELRGVLIRGEATLIEDLDAIVAIGSALYDRYTKPRTGIDVEDGPIVEIERQGRKRLGVSLPLDRLSSWDHSKLGREPG
jgi:PPOX class probable F420-dependent enzyme